MPTLESPSRTESDPLPLPSRSLGLAVVLAWALPGAGHFYLGRRGRAAFFFAIILVTFVTGWLLDGNLYRAMAGQPLTMLGMLASMGVGAPYFALRFGLDYHGVVESPGYEYGTAFLLTAGLMNLLLVLDVWDIGRGRKR